MNNQKRYDVYCHLLDENGYPEKDPTRIYDNCSEEDSLEIVFRFEYEYGASTYRLEFYRN